MVANSCYKYRSWKKNLEVEAMIVILKSKRWFWKQGREGCWGKIIEVMCDTLGREKTGVIMTGEIVFNSIKESICSREWDRNCCCCFV